jgi:hypothetical protein
MIFGARAVHQGQAKEKTHRGQANVILQSKQAGESKVDRDGKEPETGKWVASNRTRVHLDRASTNSCSCLDSVGRVDR